MTTSLRKVLDGMRLARRPPNAPPSSAPTASTSAAGQSTRPENRKNTAAAVLVLNRSFLPIHVTSVRRAFILLGKESTVESRNHSAVYRREMEKLESARRELSLPAEAGNKVA